MLGMPSIFQRRVWFSPLWLSLCVSAPLAWAQQPLTSAFTYQGELTQNGSPVTGPVSMRFLLYDSASGTNTLGAQIIDPVQVQAGVFTVELDFGSAVFNGEERWLEVIVGGQALAPRQRVAPTPYSLQTRGIFVDPALNVGIGTTSPQAKLHVQGPSGNDGVMLPDDTIGAAEILGEPGQSRGEVADLLTLTNGSPVNMVFGAIYCPTDGFVLAVAEAEFVNGLSAGGIPEIRYDVRPVGSVAAPARVFRISSSIGHRVRQTCVRVFPVQEGYRTFEFFGQSFSSEAAAGRAWNPELTLVFLPTQY